MPVTSYYSIEENYNLSTSRAKKSIKYYYSHTILYLRYLLALLELSELAGALALLGLAYVLARIYMPTPYIYLHSLV